MTAAMIADRHGYLEIVSVLIETGADVNLRAKVCMGYVSHSWIVKLLHVAFHVHCNSLYYKLYSWLVCFHRVYTQTTRSA